MVIRHPHFARFLQSDKRSHKKNAEESSERDATPQNQMAGPMIQLCQSEDYESDSDDEEDSYIFGQQDNV